MTLLPLEEYYKSLPRKGIGAGVLFFDDEDRILLVKPNYKQGWIIPGGSVDAEESPKEAAIREVREELGLAVSDIALVCVNYTKTYGIKPEAIHFIFSGGVLSAHHIQNIKLQAEELDEFQFVSLGDAEKMLAPGFRERVLACIKQCKSGQMVYFE